MLLPVLSMFILLLHTQVMGVLGCIEAERNALLSFKSKLYGPQNSLFSWRGENCCQWSGVTCNKKTGHVVKLILRNSNYNTHNRSLSSLSGEIDPSLLLLSDLEYLDLSMNDFDGASIPQFLGSFSKLKYLNLSNSCFGGILPPQLGNLSSLLYLDLNTFLCSSSRTRVNNLSWLSNLFHLKYLDMEFVDLSRAFDWLSAINMLPSLEVLDLGHTDLPEIQMSLSLSNVTNLRALSVNDNLFESTLPKWLWNLTSITYLDLSCCGFCGMIPYELSTLVSLNTLLLGYNNFTSHSPKAFNGLCNLRKFELSQNAFRGQTMYWVINDWMRDLAKCTPNKLETLILKENGFEGSMHGWLEKMTSLTTIVLSSNSLKGGIPESLWEFASLVDLDLSSNLLSGVVTEIQLGKLRSIESLSLSNNSLVVQIKNDWVPPFQLQLISLSSCDIGPRFPDWLHWQTQLSSLDLSHNNITSSIPNWLWDISQSITHLDLSGNQIKGQLPSSLSHLSLIIFHLNSNLLCGPLPSFPATLQSLDLSLNSFTGSIPQSICESQFLINFLLSNNHLSGALPSCLGRSQEHLFVVDLANNNLSGEVPAYFSARIFVLRNNSFYGGFPLSLQHQTDLLILDLGENNFTGLIPTWINVLQSLMALILRSNMFSGNIPFEIIQLNEIFILDLSHNNLSGSLPSSFAEFEPLAFTSLGNDIPQTLVKTYKAHIDHLSSVTNEVPQVLPGAQFTTFVRSFDCSGNSLVGEIPRDISSMWAIANFNLSSNFFTGEIPNEIGEVSSLETLDLRYNRFSGSIPLSIANLNFLSIMNLSYNNLSGAIPDSNQLQTMADPYIFVGNVHLCGKLINIQCAEIETINQGKNEESRERFEHLWLYLSVGLGFIFGFWTVCVVFLFKKSWRYAYFSTFDTAYDWLYVAVVLALRRARRMIFKI